MSVVITKKGIKSISGATRPEIGKTYHYAVTSLYEGSVSSIGDNDISWVLYKKQASGEWKKVNGPVKKGRSVTYSFGQIAYGHEFLIEAYRYNPEVKAPPGLIVRPQQGPPRIVKAAILDAEGAVISGKAHYGQSVTLQVTTENMVGQELKMELWEEDMGKGSWVDSDDLLWRNARVRVEDASGIVSRKVALSPTLRDKGGNWYEEGWEQEVYLSASLAGGTQVESPVQIVSLEAPKVAPVRRGNSGATVSDEESGNNLSCGEKYCIKKGDKNELVREINIRLAGFGGNVPTDEFTDRTENMVKQFQKDYMSAPQTGMVCGNVLRAIDQFQARYTIDFTEIECKCSTCSGFGDGSNKGLYLKNQAVEARHRYEYPGVHRSLVWALRSVKFYLAKDGRYSFNKVNSGYRCRFHDEYKKKPTTNHMGKALDLHFNDKNGRTRSVSDIETIRKDIFNKYLGAKWDWKPGQQNIFNLESTAVGATTWVHYDVREFDAVYLEDRFFVKDNNALNGKSIVELARELGFTDTCNCLKGGNSTPEQTEPTSGDRVDPKTLTTSEDGIEFIKDWEAFSATAYNDSEGYCTIGYGHLIDYKKCEDITLPDEFQKGITEARAMELFKERLTEFEAAVQRDITVNLYQHEFDALVSLLFNAGAQFLNVGGAGNGETKIKKNINAEQYSEGADEMADVTNGGTSGLVKRRNAEINMFKNNVYDSTH